MQGARNAKESVKESAANVAASAKSGMEKTKASVQEKVDRMTTHDPIQKGMAAEKKEERKHMAEVDKQETREHNAATRQANEAAARAGHTNVGAATKTEPYTTSGTGTGYGTGGAY